MRIKLEQPGRFPPEQLPSGSLGVKKGAASLGESAAGREQFGNQLKHDFEKELSLPTKACTTIQWEAIAITYRW